MERDLDGANKLIFREPNLKAGGRQSERKPNNDQKMSEKQGSHITISICDWGGWAHGGSCMRLDREIDILVVGPKAPNALGT